MPRRRPFLLLLGCVLLAAGCKPADDEASIRKQLDRKGTVALMDQVAKAPEYKPPADGRLTDGQVRMYLDVRRREQKIRAVASQSADATTADLRAAQDLGCNPKEYQWVRDRVMEAQMLQSTQVLHQQVAESRGALLRSLAERRKKAGAAEQATIDRQIQDLQRSAREAAEEDPARSFNAQLLARYKELQRG